MKTILSSYEFYEAVSPKPVERTEYRLINEEFNKFMVSLCLEGDEIVLPGYIGTLMVSGQRRVPRFKKNEKTGKEELVGGSVDWKRTLDLWKENPEAAKNKTRIFFTNPHTDNVFYKWYWTKRTPKRVRFKDFYSLAMSRGNRRAIPKKIFSGEYNFRVNR